jgi:hypothetical protein
VTTGVATIVVALSVATVSMMAGLGTASAEPTAMLVAVAFDDVNENGKHEPTEPGVSGATVSVFRGSRLQAEVVTGRDGVAQFAKLAKGTVSVQVTSPTLFVTVTETEVRTRVDAARPVAVAFGLVPRSERTVAVTAGSSATVAGSGVATTTDGAARAAGFASPRGLALVSDRLFVETSDSVRSVVLDAGAVTTVAGSAGLSGCDDGVGDAARFRASGPMATDGTSLYVTDFCNDGGQALRTIDIATGVTTTMWSTTSTSDRITGMAVAPNGVLYTASTVGSTHFTTVIRRWDGNTATEVASLAATTNRSFLSGSLAVDRMGVFVTTTTLDTSIDYRVLRLDLATATWTPVATMANLPTAIASTGRYLYVGSIGSIIRVDKVRGRQLLVAGSSTDQTGFADGTSTDIRFSGVTAIVANGSGLYVADSNNHRIRAIIDLVEII